MLRLPAELKERILGYVYFMQVRMLVACGFTCILEFLTIGSSCIVEHLSFRTRVTRRMRDHRDSDSPTSSGSATELGVAISFHLSPSDLSQFGGTAESSFDDCSDAGAERAAKI